MEKAMNYTQEDLILLSEARQAYIDRLEVLDKVKHLFLIPGVGLTTTAQVAAFYEVPESTIRSVSLRYRGELESDGVVTKTAQWLREAIDVASGKIDSNFQLLHNATPENLSSFNDGFDHDIRMERNGRSYSVIMNDGTIMSVSAGRTVYYTKRAVLRMGMLLRDSRIAQEVRTQLLNVYEKVSPKASVSDLNTEGDLLQEAITAMSSGDLVEAFAKMSKVAEFSLRYKEKAEKLDMENDMLATGILTTDKRLLVSRMMRYYASRMSWNNFSWAYKRLYREMAYQKMLGPKYRMKRNESLISQFSPEEIDDAIRVSASMFRESGLDIKEAVNGMNVKSYADLLAIS